MATKGKKYVDSAKLIDRAAQYDVNEAMDLVVKTATAKFDETVELHVKLGVDSRHADQQVRGAIVKAKPAAAKGQYVKSCVAASTMGPGVKISAAKYV